MEDVIFELIASAIGIALVVLVNIGLKELVLYLRAKVGSENLATARLIAERVVAAAEQLSLTDVISRAGEKKKEWAINHLESILETRGIRIDLHELSSLIEAAVSEKFSKDKAEWLIAAATLADEAVMYVEQTGGELSNEEKLAQAVAWLDDALFKRGISLTHNEVTGLIEAAVYRLPPKELP